MAERRLTRVPKASDALVRDLRTEILSNGLPDGHRLPSENELMETHGASRGAVREALRILEVEGLITLRRGRSGGVLVSHPDVSTVSRSIATILTVQEVSLREFITFRQLIEPEIAAQAATHATLEECARLAELAAEGGPRLSRSKMDVSTANFHAYLGKCSHNRVFALVLGSFYSVLEGHVRIEETDDAHHEASRRAHIRIASAISKGDPDSARKYMQRHLAAFETFLSELGQLDTLVVPYRSWSE